MDPLSSSDPASGFCGCLKGLAPGYPHIFFPHPFYHLRSLHSGLILAAEAGSLIRLCSQCPLQLEVSFPGSLLLLLNSHLIPEAFFQCKAEKSMLHASASFPFRAIDCYFHFKHLCVYYLLFQ